MFTAFDESTFPQKSSVLKTSTRTFLKEIVDPLVFHDLLIQFFYSMLKSWIVLISNMKNILDDLEKESDRSAEK